MSRPLSFKDFYHRVYQQEHKLRSTRILHVAGTTGALVIATAMVATRKPVLLPAGLVVGYGCAWAGHFFCEHNRPATFKYPVWSLMADFVMWWNILTGKEPWEITG